MGRREKPSLEKLSMVGKDGSRRAIHPADVTGRFLRRRTVVYIVLIAIYVSMPFIKVGGRPAVFLDVGARQFFLFGATFNAQDFWLVVFLLAALGFTLFFVTAWLGRVWCGWACPQTVFLEGVYRRIERWIEGPRMARIRMEDAPMSLGKALRKIAKHAAFLLVSLFLSHVLLSFFVSLGSLTEIVRQHPRENWVAFLWTMLVTAAIYFNFAWFREQLCIVICPYGRLQSALQDEHSLIIGYDVERGEPRGKIRRSDRVALPVVEGEPVKAPAQGDCVDCNRCVVVCPTGIDIRNGLQMECIGCAQCIDACDEVMIKVGRPTGLIRYDSHNGLHGLPKKTARPRLALYGAFLSVAVVGLMVGLWTRTPFEANLLRMRGAPFIMGEASIRNQFELHLVNKNPTTSHFRVEVKGARDQMKVTMPQESIELQSLQDYRLPIFVEVPREGFEGPFELEIWIGDGNSERERTVSGTFLGPQARR